MPAVSRERLGKYVVEEELGRGGMGVVYRGVDSESGREVALKVLPAQLALDPSFYHRFRREILALKQLDHPGIVKILDEGEQDGALWYAMELVKGTTLDNVLLRNRLHPRKATDIILQCARILEYAHARGVIHRDLKPGNIMLSDAGTVKLADFGIAKLADATRVTATSSILGTVEYMSPEQSRGRFVDPRSDIYSLGVVYYQAVTGRLPVTGRNATEIVLNLRAKPVEAPNQWVPGLPPRLNELILRMLEKDPARRVPSAKALVRELEVVQAQLEAPTSAVAEQMLPPVSASRVGRRWYANFWVWAAMLLVIAGGAWLAAKRWPTPPAVRWERAEQLMLAGRSLGNMQRAIQELELLQKEHPHSEWTQRAAERITAIRAALQEETYAQRIFASANMVYLQARKHRDAKALAVARGMLLSLLETYPNFRRVAEARRMIEEIDRGLAGEGREAAPQVLPGNVRIGEKGEDE